MNDLFENDSVLNLDNGHYISLSAIENFFDIQSLSSTLLEQKKKKIIFLILAEVTRKQKRKHCLLLLRNPETLFSLVSDLTLWLPVSKH